MADSVDLEGLASSGEDGIFTSCSAVGAHLETDTDFWCFELEANDYSQVFQIAWLFLLISLGYYLLTLGACIWGSTALKGIKCPMNRNGNDTENENALQLPFNLRPELQWFENNNIASSFTLPIYLLMYIAVSLIYFVIKIFIVSTENSKYIWTFDDLFIDKDFTDFVDAKVIIMIWIFLVNSTFFCFTNLTILCAMLYVMVESEINKVSIVLLFCWIVISLTDATFSIIVCCIYYPMIVTILYIVAVLVIVDLTIALICCCISPCVSCICIRMCVDLLGLMRRRYVDNAVEIQCVAPCVRFIYALVLSILLMVFLYLSQCLALSYMFSFLGGPPKSVIYMDFSSENDNIIFWLFTTTHVLGFIAFLIGLLFSCWRNRDLVNENDEINRSMIDERAERNEDRDMRRRNRHDYQRSDPFADPSRGYRLVSNGSSNVENFAAIDDEVNDDSVAL